MSGPTVPPTGCPFNPRCFYSEKICSEKKPELVSLKNSICHSVVCHCAKTKIPEWK
ncbi:MAG TPA: hypothetical protein PL110_15130 [Candidatus Eremiobacteraeota bacterium]|nr:hypothetical protein [Candidatus Eremiobacteraeota bacterium]